MADEPYRSEIETLRAKLAMAEEEARDAVTDLAEARQFSYTPRDVRTYVLASIVMGIAIGCGLIGGIVEWRDSRAENLPAPSALVIHNAWCYRVHDLSYSSSSLSWTTQHGTRMGAAYDNVTVVVPRCTEPRCWDDAYEDALIEDAGDCQ